MFALNQGEVCTCPSRALVQKLHLRSVHGSGRQTRREPSVRAIRINMSTQIGAQASNDQFEKILAYIDIGKKEGAKVLTGGTANKLSGELAGGYYIKPTVFEGHNKMRIFQEEIFGPVVSVTVFDTPGSGAGDRQRHHVRIGFRRLDARSQSCLPVRAGHQGRAEYGPIAITPIRRTRHSAAIRNPASAGRPIK